MSEPLIGFFFFNLCCLGYLTTNILSYGLIIFLFQCVKQKLTSVFWSTHLEASRCTVKETTNVSKILSRLSPEALLFPAGEPMWASLFFRIEPNQCSSSTPTTRDVESWELCRGFLILEAARGLVWLSEGLKRTYLSLVRTPDERKCWLFWQMVSRTMTSLFLPGGFDAKVSPYTLWGLESNIVDDSWEK